MLKITRKFDYAMLLLTELGLRPRDPASARSIAERHRLSQSLAANVLKGLQRNSLVRSLRGAHGGYLLARSPDRISLNSIMTAIDGNRSMAKCARSGRKKGGCPARETCPSRGYMALLEGRIRSVFEESTLADVISHVARRKPSVGDGP